MSLALPGREFQIVSFASPFEVTDSGWQDFKEWDRQDLQKLNKTRRDQAGAQELKYWAQRHEQASQYVQQQNHDETLTIDDFFSSELQSLESLDDLSFLRRVTLDIVGTIPSREIIEEYLAIAKDKRRSTIVDRLLESEGWADHWVGYWQDVLAENPNIVNPTLNNTGPFRWWIHESFLENKPFDRFVTELIRMEGGDLTGGPGGFALATENDVPMAAKKSHSRSGLSRRPNAMRAVPRCSRA